MKPALVCAAAALGAAQSYFEKSLPLGDGSKLDWFEHPEGDTGECEKVLHEMFDNSPSAERVEKLCGTEAFCGAFNPEWSSRNDIIYVSKIYGYKDDTACFDAHDPDPTKTGNRRRSAAKLPWILTPPGEANNCQIAFVNMFREIPTPMRVERICGTYNFCGIYNPITEADLLRDLTLKYGYKNMAECFNAHAPDPAPEANY